MSTPVQDRRRRGPARRSRHELLVDREYEASRDEVLRTVRAKLRAAGVELDDADLEAAYNQAWHALYLMLAEGERVDNRIAMLVTITHRRSLDDHRAQRVDRRTELAPDLPAPRPDVERRIDEQRQLRAVRSGMRERLSGRELQAATLCYLHQRTRPEAAEIMGLSPRRMEKVMDRVSKRFGELVRDVQGDWCATQDSLIRAYALGVLAPDGERHQLATEHLSDCPSCRRRVLALRGLAAVAPPVPLLLGGAGLAGGGAAGGAGERAGDGSSAGSGGSAGSAGGGAGAAAGAGASAATGAATSGAAGGGAGASAGASGAGAAAGSAAGAAGLSGARGAGRALGRLGRGSTRANLVAAGAVTATIAVAATAIALSSGGSDPGDGARPGGAASGAGAGSSGAGGGTGDGAPSGSGRGATAGANGSRRDDATGTTATTARGASSSATKRGKASSGTAAGERRASRSTASRSTTTDASSRRASGTSSSAAATGRDRTGGAASPGPASTTTTPATPATTPARPSAPRPSTAPRGTGSPAASPPKATPETPEKVVEDGAEEFELH